MAKSTNAIDALTKRCIAQGVRETPFTCECGWTGQSDDLASLNEMSCCPQCDNLDIRLDLTDLGGRILGLFFDGLKYKKSGETS